MTSPREYAQHVADALVDVIEDARWKARIGSVRELASRAGMTHTALNARMNRKTPFNVRDLAAIGQALGTHPADFLTAAKAKADREIQEAKDAARAQQRKHDSVLAEVTGLNIGLEDLDEPEQIAAHDSAGLIADEQEASDTP